MIGLSVAGTVIGAGFATGKEIMLFFPKKGTYGIISLFISLFLIALVSLLYCYKNKTRYDKILDYIFTFFLGASFSVMLSCGGETIYEISGLPFYLGVMITYITSLFIIHFNLKGIYIFNIIASPLMIIFTIIISLQGLITPVFNIVSPAFYSVAYSGYNLMSLIPFLSSLKKSEKDNKSFIAGTFLGILFVLICGIFIKLVTDRYLTALLNSEIPMLKIAFLNNNYIGYIYSFLTFSSILTTSISCLLPLKEKGNIYLITFPLLLVSFFGFSNLIKNIYGSFGNIGTIFIIYIIITAFTYKKEI